MERKRLAQLLLLAAATVVLGGCSKPNSIVGRWSGGSSSFHFREDGTMFHIVPSGARYRGNYYIDSSTSPMVITSRLHPMGGAAGARDVTWQVEFVTKDRLRVVIGEAGSGNRPQIFKRVTREEASEQTGAK